MCGKRFRFFATLLCAVPLFAAFSEPALAKNIPNRRARPTAPLIKPTGKTSNSTDSKQTDGVTSVAIPRLESASVLVVDQQGRRIFEKNVETVLPIASITKVMTAMVVLDANLPMDEMIVITKDDVDRLRHSSSRLIPGRATLSREQMLRVALMSSENRAASALGRTTFPGGTAEFVAAMNNKAQALGMTNTKFADPTGLFVENVSTAADLYKMLNAAYKYQLIREATSTPETRYSPHPKKKTLRYINTNRLVRAKNPNFEVQLSKTGFINEAGHCLIMKVSLPSGSYDFVLLSGPKKLSHVNDASKIGAWLQKTNGN